MAGCATLAPCALATDRSGGAQRNRMTQKENSEGAGPDPVRGPEALQALDAMRLSVAPMTDWMGERRKIQKNQ